MWLPFHFYFPFSRAQYQEFSESRTEANVPVPIVSFFTGKTRAGLSSESMAMRGLLFLLSSSALHPNTPHAEQNFDNETMYGKTMISEKSEDFVLSALSLFSAPSPHCSVTFLFLDAAEQQFFLVISVADALFILSAAS